MGKAWRVSNYKNYLQWLIAQSISKKGTKKIKKEIKDIKKSYEKISIHRALSKIESLERLTNEEDEK